MILAIQIAAVILLAFFIFDCRVRIAGLLDIVRRIDPALVEAHGWALKHNDEIADVAERLGNIEGRLDDIETGGDAPYLKLLALDARLDAIKACWGRATSDYEKFLLSSKLEALGDSYIAMLTELQSREGKREKEQGAKFDAEQALKRKEER
jgi:hypothetical protein